MKGMPRILCGITIMSVLPLMANAAGTYYNGNMYQNPQNRYSNNTTTAAGGGFYNTYGAGRGYGQNMQNAQAMQNMGTRKTTTVQTVQKTTTTAKAGTDYQKQGVYLNADLSHEFASWNFDMKNAGSKLHYDNLRWNAVSADLAYYFGDSTPMQIKIGGKYGMQFGDSPMIDDDITSGGLWTVYPDDAVEGTPAVSIGTSSGGKEYGINASFGLTNVFGNDRIKVTPSIGYRYLKYELSTKDNAGAMIQVYTDDAHANCFNYNGEIQCAPYVGFTDVQGNEYVLVGVGGLNQDGLVPITGGSYIDLGSTYYYEQPGTSHKYETEWAGPYIALDMEYMIDNDNVVDAGIEVGLPTYKSTGDQPYRFDWAHPKSVEDKGGFGDAWHIGLNAMWSTAVSDSMMFSVGMTYDYYHVKGADATTYLNATYYQEILTYYEDLYAAGMATTADVEQMNELQSLKADGWSLKSNGEIESIYKSMGLRIGLNIKF